MGAEFSTVLFPLRHVAPFFPLSSHVGERERDGEEKERAPLPGWSSSRDFLACFPGYERDGAIGAKIQEPNRAGDVNFLALSSLMGFSSPFVLQGWSFSILFSFLRCLSFIAIEQSVAVLFANSQVYNSKWIYIQSKVIILLMEPYNYQIAQSLFSNQHIMGWFYVI